MECPKCSFHNLEGTNYCQSCGAKLKEKKKLDLSSLKYSAGLGNKGVSVAPIAARKIEEQSNDLEKIEKKKLVKVIKREDGSWYCPECGEYNQAYTTFCKGCGRDH